MKEFSDMDHFQPSEDLVGVLKHKTGSTDPLFFRVLVAYYFSKIASMMRCNIETHDRGSIPVNMYAINLANSGHGKGHSTNIMEEQVINQFRENYLSHTFPFVSEQNIIALASNRAASSGRDAQTEMKAVEDEFKSLGPVPFSFDSGTQAAVKQVRHKLLMAQAGSLNFEMDEIGSNLLSNVDVMNTYLELYDIGKVKPKLIKNTKEAIRSEDIDGRTPTNMMLFGTPIKLFDGGKVEEAFMDFLSTGYARRCHFSFTKQDDKANDLTPSELYDLMTDPGDVAHVDSLSDMLGQLADAINFNRTIRMTKDIAILIIEYKKDCDIRASVLADHEEIKKAELSHRYFKAMKVAGTYAFISGSPVITEDLLYNSIKLTEESGDAFNKLLTRDRPFVKLAKYIASVNREVTHVDLVEDLPFYKGPDSHKKEMMTLAIAYGYRNNIIIKKTITDGIEFMKGESLDMTDTKKVTVSYSSQVSSNYKNEEVDFDDFHKLSQTNGFNWVAHHVLQGHRREDSIMQGFNLIVLDIDGGTPISTVQLLMDKYTYHLYTTKSHTDKENRFRLVLPMTHTLKLDKDDYTQFMENVYEWLPFAVDDSTKDRCRKWASWNGEYHDNKGELLDSLIFIPKTSKNEERKKLILDQAALSNLERWFLMNSNSGNRNNTLIKYALMLVDSGKDDDTIRSLLLTFNDKLPNSLSETEIDQTIMRSVVIAITKRDI